MLGFRDLPYLVNEQIIRNLFNPNWHIVQKLFLLAVCHSWRQIALPLIYDTLHICEYNLNDPVPANKWKQPDPLGRLWDLNIAPFNAHDLARCAKNLRITIYSPEAFENLVPLLKHIFLHYPCGWKRMTKLELWAYGTTNHISRQEYLSRSSLLFSTYLFDVFPSIAGFMLNSTFASDDVAYMFTQLLTAYSINLHNLSMPYPVALGGPIYLQNLTVLDLKIARDECQLLSFVNPQILHKLSIDCDIGIYMWKYFSPHTISVEPLNFAKLTELSITSYGCVENEDGGYASHYSDESEAEYEYMSEHKRLCKVLEHDISQRRVLLPRLKVFRVVGSHLNDLLFKNCVFSDNMHQFKLYESASCIAYSSWLLSHISAKHVRLQINSHSDYCHCISRYEKIIGPGLGNKINSLVLNMYPKIDPAMVDLGMVSTLHIHTIDYSTVTALIRVLPRLQRLTIGFVTNDNVDDSIDGALLDPEKTLASPLSSSIATLVVQHIHENFMAMGLLYIKYLVIGLPQLRYVALGKESVEVLQSFVTDNQNKYTHFKSLFLTLWKD